MDANFNRAREALRVVEEYCRFSLGDVVLSSRAKELRHVLSGIMSELDGGRLLGGRDSRGDVGAGAEVAGQMERGELRDCVTAACKRLSEALRVLAETGALHEKALSGRFEKLRFAGYSLEKDIAVTADPAARYAKVRLYVVITSDLPAELLSLAAHCAKGGADCIQMRTKEVPDDRRFAMAREFVRICADEGVLSIVNDRADVAIAAGADGMHAGQNDLPVEQIRALQTRPLIIGKSTHAMEQLRAAIDERVTYAALGPVFPTGTKPKVPAVTLDYVHQGSAALEGTGIHNVAIGGITGENVEQVLEAGARSIAVCAAATKVADPQEACRGLKEQILRFFER